MVTIKDKWHHASHCKYLIKLQIILVCKYRKKLLEGAMKDDIKKHLQDAAKMKDFNIETMESDVDHIHMLVDIKQTQATDEIVKMLKQLSTHRIWLEHADKLKAHFFGKKKIFWTRGYFACSVGGAEEEVIRKYIEEQGKKG